MPGTTEEKHEELQLKEPVWARLEHETPPKYKAGMAICSLKQFFHLTVG
jgi:hypothetical protein